MSTQLKLNVNNLYNFNSETLLTLDSAEITENTYHVLEGNTSFSVEVLERNFNKKEYTINVNGNNYTVLITDSLDALINNLGLTIKNSHKSNEVKAPIPGLIISVSIKEGQEVEEGDPLLVLEAMKMESTFTSPKGGIVKHISVKTGDTVDKGQVLVKIE